MSTQYKRPAMDPLIASITQKATGLSLAAVREVRAELRYERKYNPTYKIHRKNIIPGHIADVFSWARTRKGSNYWHTLCKQFYTHRVNQRKQKTIHQQLPLKGI